MNANGKAQRRRAPRATKGDGTRRAARERTLRARKHGTASTPSTTGEPQRQDPREKNGGQGAAAMQRTSTIERTMGARNGTARAKRGSEKRKGEREGPATEGVEEEIDSKMGRKQRGARSEGHPRERFPKRGRGACGATKAIAKTTAAAARGGPPPPGGGEREKQAGERAAQGRGRSDKATLGGTDEAGGKPRACRDNGAGKDGGERESAKTRQGEERQRRRTKKSEGEGTGEGENKS